MKRFLTAAAVFLTLLAPLAAANEPSPTPKPTAKPSATPDVPPAVSEAEAQRIAVMAKAKDSVLAIFSPTGEGGGSGVVISPDGYALSNFHVTSACGESMKCGMADGKVYDAVIVGLDPTGDVALIKLFGRDDFPHATLADSDQVRMGDWVFAMGNPFLLATDFQPTVTYGIVSGVHRYQYPSGTLLEYADCIQTDASINPGNSGGPLFDDQGRLIGINGRGSFEKRGRVNVGAGYAISINQIKNFLGCLRSGRIVDHATLGATVGFDQDGRVVVTDILQDSDAYRRGLRYDDEIVSLGGRPITTPNGFKNVLGIYPKGWRVPLSYRREGQRHDILVRLTGVHAEGELASALQSPPKAPMPIPKPDDKPQGDRKPGESPKKDKNSDDDVPPIPLPMPHPKDQPRGHARQAKPPLAEVVKKHFEEKVGYANYFFNQQNQKRVWDAWTTPGKFATMAGAWTLTGERQGGGDFRLTIRDADLTLQLPNDTLQWTATDELASSLQPSGSGGLFPALHLWRRLAVEGLGRFGQVYYLGTLPLVGHQGLVDVVVGLHAGAECRFYFEPATGRLLAMEMYSDNSVDPCELLFSEYRDIEGRSLPTRIEARFGDEVFTVFTVRQFKITN
jgi:S1-C subfamily serine protease